MQLLTNGLLLGLMLTIMVGPIMIALVQTSFENGWKSGIRVGMGIWLSDLLFIAACYIGIKQVRDLTNLPGFTFWVGIIGGVILFSFGIGLLLKHSTPQEIADQVEEMHLEKFNAWMRGFLINTVNPFTFIFWTTVSLTVLANETERLSSAFLFYGGIMFVVIIGDAMKVFLAEKIRHWLTPKHIHQIRLVSGIAFLLFGVAMVIRVI